MDMMDMSYKVSGPQVEESSKNKVNYPTLHLNKNIPDKLGEKDVGDMCDLHIQGKVVSKSENSEYGDELTIEIHKMGYMGKGKVSEDEYKKMSPEEKDKADEEEVMSKK